MAALAENVYSIIFLEAVSLSSFELPEDLYLKLPFFCFQFLSHDDVSFVFQRA